MKSWLPAVVVRRAAWAACAAWAAWVGLAGCRSDPAGDATDGPAVFQSLCATCHGADGHPPAAMVARLGVRDLTAPEFRARVSLGAVEQQVRQGSQNKLMPAFEGAISEAQIRSVAAYVASPAFAGPAGSAAPAAPPAAPR